MRTHARHRSTGRGRVIGALVTTTTLAIGGLGFAAPAYASDKLGDVPVASVVKEVAERVAPSAPAPSRTTSTPARSKPARTVSEPAGGDASGRALGLGLGGGEIAVIGESKAGGGDDGTKAESRSLAVLGTTVIGSEASNAPKSRKPRKQKSGDILLPLCEGSGGALCAELLYADSETSSTKSKARSGLLHVCLGGDDRSGDSCTGPIEASVLTSDAFHVIRKDGSEKTGGSSEVLGLCLTSTGDGCDLGLSLLGSGGVLSSDGTSKQESSIITGELMGNEAGDGGAGQELGLPSCDDLAVICLGLNQNEAEQREDGTVLLGGSPLAAGVLSDNIAAALAANESGSRAAGDGNRTGKKGGKGGNGGDGGDGGSGNRVGDDSSPVNAGGIPGDDGVLPDTGGPAGALLLLGLGLLAAGGLIRRSA